MRNKTYIFIHKILIRIDRERADKWLASTWIFHRLTEHVQDNIRESIAALRALGIATAEATRALAAFNAAYRESQR